MRISDWSSDVCSSDLMIERIERAFGRRDHLDPEAVEKRARTEGVGRQRLGDAVVIKVRRLGRELHVESERLGEHPVHPNPRRSAAQEMIILREYPPAFSRVGRAVPDTQDRTSPRQKANTSVSSL